MTLAVVAPTDAQLGYIATLCERRNLLRPRAVHSFQEAGEIIDAIKDGSTTKMLRWIRRRKS